MAWGAISRSSRLQPGEWSPLYVWRGEARHCQRLVALTMVRRARRPVERLDAMLTEEKTQFGGMSLDVAHAVELQLQKADGPPLRPRIFDGTARLLVRQRLDGRAAVLAH